MNKENWMVVVSFRTELLTEALLHKGYREGIPEMFPKLPSFRNRMIIDNDIYIDLNEINKLKEYINQDIFKKGNHIYNTIKNQIQIFLDFVQELDITSKIPTEELIETIEDFLQLYKYAVGPIGLPTTIDLLLDEKIVEMLEKEGFNDVEQSFNKIAISKKSIETNQEHLDLLDLAIKLKGISSDSAKFIGLVEKHSKKYGWVRSTLLQIHPYDSQKIIDEIKSIKDPEKEKERLLKQRAEQVKSAKEIIEKIKSSEGKALARFLQKAVYYRTARLEWLNKACYLSKPLLDQAAHILGIKYDELIYLLPEEIIQGLKAGQLELDPKTICERMKGYAFVSDNNVENILFTGKELEKLKQQFSKSEEGDMIQGMVTCKGKVEGRAKIIKDRRDLAKIEDGDVLVTRLTTPDFIVAMKKAVAIVTDLGGITSHAAIVSRELGKPCIVGTGNATKVFKDGDMVEIDANKGIVRKIT